MILANRSYFFVLLFLFNPLSFASLQGDIFSLIKEKSPPNTQWGMLIEEADSEETIVEIEPTLKLIPASNMKIVSGGAALLGLGPEFKYETTLFRTGVHTKNKITGHLVVTGNGDPSIGGRFNGGDITAVFRTWAETLKQKNMNVITGDLVGVDHAFDTERYGLNWNPEDYVEWYAAEISALALNDSCIDLVITGASKAGQKASIELDPPTSYMKITNRIRTVSTRKQERLIEFIRESDSTALTVRGAVRVNKHIREYASVPVPTLFFLTVLKETFEKEGIEIQGKLRVAKRENFQLKLENWYEIGKHKSPPFTELLGVCLRNSQNLYSEHFLKTLGYRGYGKGSLQTGVLVLKDMFFMNGFKIDGQYIADGSGLSRDNRINAKALVDVLRCMKNSKYSKEFQQALPISGISGTIKNRMKDNAAYQRVYAKTGTLTGVRGLSGYLKAKSGKEYIFSMLANGTHKGTKFNSIMDDICGILAEKG